MGKAGARENQNYISATDGVSIPNTRIRTIISNVYPSSVSPFYFQNGDNFFLESFRTMLQKTEMQGFRDLPDVTKTASAT